MHLQKPDNIENQVLLPYMKKSGTVFTFSCVKMRFCVLVTDELFKTLHIFSKTRHSKSFAVLMLYSRRVLRWTTPPWRSSPVLTTRLRLAIPGMIVEYHPHSLRILWWVTSSLWNWLTSGYCHDHYKLIKLFISKANLHLLHISE